MLIARRGLLNLPDGELDSIPSSGRENAVGIAALGKAMDLLLRTGLDTISRREKAPTRRAIQSLRGIPGDHIYGVLDFHSHRFANRGPCWPLI